MIFPGTTQPDVEGAAIALFEKWNTIQWEQASVNCQEEYREWATAALYGATKSRELAAYLIQEDAERRKYLKQAKRRKVA